MLKANGTSESGKSRSRQGVEYPDPPLGHQPRCSYFPVGPTVVRMVVCDRLAGRHGHFRWARNGYGWCQPDRLAGVDVHHAGYWTWSSSLCIPPRGRIRSSDVDFSFVPVAGRSGRGVDGDRTHLHISVSARPWLLDGDATCAHLRLRGDASDWISRLGSVAGWPGRLTARLWPRTLLMGAGDAPYRCLPSIGPHDTDGSVSPPRHVGHGVGAGRSCLR